MQATWLRYDWVQRPGYGSYIKYLYSFYYLAQYCYYYCSGNCILRNVIIRLATKHLKISRSLLFLSALPAIVRVTIIKILGVTFTNSLSVAAHVHTVISSSAQTLYTLSESCDAHGMDHVSLQTVYRSVVVAKLTCFQCLVGIR